MSERIWNFHSYIAIPLEGKARHYYGDPDNYRQKIYGADQIELAGTFAEVMIILLREKTQYSIENSEVSEFVKECAQYIGMSLQTIGQEKVQDLYNRFSMLYNSL